MRSRVGLWLPTCLLLLLCVGCGPRGVRVDGSSTVYPISLAMAEEFTIDHPGSPVSVAFSGTGAGISKLCAGEIDVANASRVIRRSELDACAANGISVIELPVAADAITVVINPGNEFARCLTLAELHHIWQPHSDVDSWNQVRSGFPGQPLVLYGPGTDSGTFEYFTQAVNGMAGATRTDFFPSEDDNVLVQGVQSDRFALGYFGFAYYAANPVRVAAVAIDSGAGCVLPSAASIENGTYTPLSRPLFLYLSLVSLEAKPALAEFIDYYLAAANRQYIAETGYVTYGNDIYQAVADRFLRRVTGTAFADFRPGDDVLDAVRRAE